MFGWLRRKKAPELKLDREEALAAIPVRNPHVQSEQEGEGMLLSYELEPTRAVRAVTWFMNRFGKGAPPSLRKVELDKVGRHVWEMCDGEHTVRDVATSISKNFRVPGHEAEHSTVLFLRTLASRGLIALLVKREQEGEGGEEAPGTQGDQRG